MILLLLIGNQEMVERRVNTLNDEKIEILALLAVGTAEGRIAERLCMSAEGVRTETSAILKKVNVPNLLQAVL